MFIMIDLLCWAVETLSSPSLIGKSITDVCLTDNIDTLSSL